MTGFKIDFSEKFERLKNAPIVEAVVSIHAKPERRFEEKELLEVVKAKLPDFPMVNSQNESSVTFKIGTEGQAPSTGQTISWKGLILQSADQLQRAQFNQDGFLFSRFFPYTEWNHFSEEAFRLFNLYRNVGQPKEVQRLGLRFVNRFQMPPGENRFEDYIQPYPEPPFGLDLPFAGFLHQDSFVVPGYPYGINVIRTIQPPILPNSPGVGLIIDADVFTTVPYEIDMERTKRHFDEMRWLKNKVFFGSVTEKSVKLFQ